MKDLYGKAALAITFGLLCFVAGGGQWPQPAQAASNPGFSDSFTVACGTSATAIQSPFNQLSYMCEVDEAATAPVFVGGSGVLITTGVEFDAAEDFGGNVRKEFCVVTTGTVDINCRAQVAIDPDA